MKKLQVGFDAMLRATPTAFHKYMFNRINWNNPSTVTTLGVIHKASCFRASEPRPY